MRIGNSSKKTPSNGGLHAGKINILNFEPQSRGGFWMEDDCPFQLGDSQVNHVNFLPACNSDLPLVQSLKETNKHISGITARSQERKLLKPLALANVGFSRR